MDFKTNIFPSYPQSTPLPFFMTYPVWNGRGQEQEILRDLEYLQQTYPEKVRRYQGKVADILDKMDYEGSMIYDEYPDKFTIARLAKTIAELLNQEEDTQAASEEMMQILLCDEIYKRRHGGRRGFLRF